MAGCNECKFYDSKLGDYLNGSYQMIRNCSLGKNEEMNKWWENNGKKRGDLNDMDCHEHHDSTKALISLNNKAQEILDLLKE